MIESRRMTKRNGSATFKLDSFVADENNISLGTQATYITVGSSDDAIRSRALSDLCHNISVGHHIRMLKLQVSSN